MQLCFDNAGYFDAPGSSQFQSRARFSPPPPPHSSPSLYHSCLEGHEPNTYYWTWKAYKNKKSPVARGRSQLLQLQMMAGVATLPHVALGLFLNHFSSQHQCIKAAASSTWHMLPYRFVKTADFDLSIWLPTTATSFLRGTHLLYTAGFQSKFPCYARKLFHFHRSQDKWAKYLAHKDVILYSCSICQARIQWQAFPPSQAYTSRHSSYDAVLILLFSGIVNISLNNFYSCFWVTEKSQN